MLNKVILIGNLGKDPEIRTLDSGRKVASFSIATNESYKDKNGEWQTNTEWHNLVAWGNLAERCEKLSKGELIYAEGKNTTRKWQDNEGNDKYRNEVVVYTIKGLERKEKSGDQQNATSEAQSPSETQSTTPVNQDSIPF